MTQPPDETPDFLAKPVPPSGDQAPPEAPPTQLGPPPTSPYTSPPPPQQGYPEQPAFQPSYQQQPPYQPYLPQPSPYGTYAPQPGMPGYPFAQSHSGANTAMGLGITSVVSALLTFACCLAAVGILAGPFAIALALRARKEMAQSPGLYNNEGAATTGLITGIIGTVIGLLGIALVVFVFGAFFAVGGSGSDY